MALTAASRMLRRSAPAAMAGVRLRVQTAAAARRRNSFIKQVMDQVKKDMEADEKLKKDWEKVQKTSEKMKERSEVAGGRVEEFGENVKSMSSKTSEILSEWRKRASDASASMSEKANQATEQNESLKKASEFAKSAGDATSERSRAVFSRARDTFSGVMDTTSQAFSYFGDEHKKGDKIKAWKAARDAAAAAEEAKAAAAEAAAAAAEGSKAEGAEGASAQPPPPEPETAMVVSKAHSSSWDRFGANLRDMPFLGSVFDNPLFDRMFGESEIAASIREMKELDPSFFLEEFADDMEYVIAPHIIKSYLKGDQEALQLHLGEASFLAVNAGIKERQRQRLQLDTAILAGPKEVELKGAKLMEQGPPCFIWTFNMQQVNCLRDKDGEIIEGAVDDIRTVCYAMAVTRHPLLEDPKMAEKSKLDASALEYPWQVSELAILWNQQCF